ncbi:hypothetical protein AVEN_208683-1 [Araneus ventricosus]|uniref:HTH CENPB-type domain-containing protein n=1 Tax=Araneus ventricosus TaxID=182803 RepID=A0A4Y2KW80_ARAVE|nr:hypothetical protein AVEN_208683-1 [Araneus ventricosus]
MDVCLFIGLNYLFLFENCFRQSKFDTPDDIKQHFGSQTLSSNVQICDQERNRQLLSPYEYVDKTVLPWIKYALSQNAPISWNVLKEKSLEFANELGESSFVASNGWLQRFNSRHNLSFKKLCGEAADFDSSSLKEWKDVVFLDILERYESASVFNVDECGPFYRIFC